MTATGGFPTRNNLNRPAVGGMMPTNTADMVYNLNNMNQPPSIGATSATWNPALTRTTASPWTGTNLQNNIQQPVSLQQNVVVNAMPLCIVGP